MTWLRTVTVFSEQENERLCEELAHSEKELKSIRARYFEENQKLNIELMNAR